MTTACYRGAMDNVNKILGNKLTWMKKQEVILIQRAKQLQLSTGLSFLKLASAKTNLNAQLVFFSVDSKAEPSTLNQMQELEVVKLPRDQLAVVRKNDWLGITAAVALAGL
ncbi:hypothetical protein A4A49_54583 [Nicotiana attenuata]|uniref:Uncharacterized protein n=1 Tax=Nicotiana attenuata TaxID=49451 RepID=A0A1J6KIW5_NICAT|nr:hypothetical protein A4A49_54583 [Nicotiana attenuata]